MVYIEKITYTGTDSKDPINFKFSDGTELEGTFYKSGATSRWFINMRYGSGQLDVFRKLNIVDTKDAIFKRVCGYEPTGAWPEANTHEDCVKFLDSLKYINKPVSLDISIIGKETIKTTDVIVSVPKKKPIKLNFNI